MPSFAPLDFATVRDRVDARTVSDAELHAALDLDQSPTDYDAIVAAGDARTLNPGEQDLFPDDIDSLFTAMPAQTPRTPHAAIANLKKLRQHHTPIGGVNLCLYNIRHNAWDINALWPSAEDATRNSSPRHTYLQFTDVPRGMSVGFLNGGDGHIVLSLGGGLCDTSDYHQAGYNGVATLAHVYTWCRATSFYGLETVNGVDCWPDPVPEHKPGKPHWTKDQLLDQLKRDRAQALANGRDRKAANLEHWIQKLSK